MKMPRASMRPVVCLLGLLALGGQSLAQAQFQPVTVQVSVSDNESYLEFDTPSQCGNSNGRGCIQAQPGTQQRITIVLGGDERCSSGGRWGLSAIILGGEGSPTKPTRWGGLNLAANDFDVDPASGIVRPENGSNRNQMKFINRNSAAYDVWYTVQAECNGRVIEADPRIRNGGGR